MRSTVTAITRFVACALFGVVLAGCGGSSSDELEAVQERLEELEAELAEERASEVVTTTGAPEPTTTTLTTTTTTTTTTLAPDFEESCEVLNINPATYEEFERFPDRPLIEYELSIRNALATRESFVPKVDFLYDGIWIGSADAYTPRTPPGETNRRGLVERVDEFRAVGPEVTEISRLTCEVYDLEVYSGLSAIMPFTDAVEPDSDWTCEITEFYVMDIRGVAQIKNPLAERRVFAISVDIFYEDKWVSSAEPEITNPALPGGIATMRFMDLSIDGRGTEISKYSCEIYEVFETDF